MKGEVKRRGSVQLAPENLLTDAEIQKAGQARRKFMAKALAMGAGTAVAPALMKNVLAADSDAIGEGDKAIQSLEQILQKDPLDGEALLLAGDYYSKSGEREKAEFRFESAAQIGGFEADALLKHAQLHVQAQKYPQAIELLRKAQKIKPRDMVQRYLEKVEQVARGRT